MRLALINGVVLTPRGFADDLTVVVEGGRIASVTPRGTTPPGHAINDLAGAYLLPGFIDSQVNGGGDALFNDAPTVDTIRRMGAAHRRFGTTGFLPTLISDGLDAIRAAIAAVEEAIAVGVPGVLGIHIEGPFLSADRKGVHDPERFRTLAHEHLDLLTSLRGGRTLITIAPERAEPALVRALADRGAVVTLGHSDCGHAEATAAFAHGATGVTHLFNAMSQLTGREPGMVGAALEADEVWCALIVDGRHVAPASLRIAARCKPADKLMLVSDAMPLVGGVGAGFTLFGKPVTVRDGVCMTADGTLAGSHLDMAGAVRNTVALMGLPLERAAAMASTYPAAFLRLEAHLGRIVPGGCASMVALDRDLNVLTTWIDGSAEHHAGS